MEFSINKTYKLSFKDYLTFNFFFNRTFKSLRIYFLIIAAFVFILLTSSDGDMTTASFWGEWGLWTLLGSTIMTFYFLLMTFLGAKRAYNVNRIGEIELNVTFSHKGISQHENQQTSFVEWENLYKVGERKTILAFLINSRHGLIVPKSIFSAEELETLMTFIKENSR